DEWDLWEPMSPMSPMGPIRPMLKPSRNLPQQLDRLRLLLVLDLARSNFLEVLARLGGVVALEVAARDPEPRIDEVLVLAEAVRLHGPLERGGRVVEALLRVVDAAEVREGVEEVVRALLDAVEHLPVIAFGVVELAAVEVDRAAEQQRVPVEVRVVERRVRIEERQRLAEEVQRLVERVQRVRVQRLQGQRLRRHVRVLRIAQ